MAKKRGCIRKNAVNRAEGRVHLISKREPDDVRFAVGSQSGSGPASGSARGLRPIGEAVFRVVSGLRRGHYVKPTTGEET
jgi:hypothetical protein